MLERLFNAYQVADLLGVSAAEVADWVQKGQLPVERVDNGSVRISERSLTQFLRKKGIDIEAIFTQTVLKENTVEPAPQPNFSSGAAMDSTGKYIKSIQSQVVGHEPIEVKAANESPESSPESNVETDEVEQAQVESAEAEISAAAARAFDEQYAWAKPESATGARPARREPAELAQPAELNEPAQLDEPAQQAQSDEPAVSARSARYVAQPSAASRAAQPPARNEEPARDSAQQVVEAILRDAVARKAENIVLESTAAGLSLRVRIDGVLLDKANFRLRLPRSLGPQVVERFMDMCGLAESAQWEQGSLSFWVDGREHAFELSTCPLAEGRRLVIRPIATPEPLRLEELGIDAADRDALRLLLCRRAGLIVLAAPAGCGKSTTLAAAVGELAARACDVVAVGDKNQPAVAGASNIRIKGIGASEMIGLAAGQRPDALVIPAVRDIAAVRAALEAASQTLVLLVLKARDFDEALAMLAEAGAAPWELSATLLAVLCQRKVRTLCPHCKAQAAPSAQLSAELGLGSDAALTAYSGAGCNACSGSGYLGQTGIFALTQNDAPLSSAIRRDAAEEISALARRQGTLRDKALAKVRQADTSLAELRRAHPL